MIKQHYKTVIFGATFYGLSKLAANPEDCVVIERTTLPGAEFVDSFYTANGKNLDMKSSFASSFKADLTANGYLSEHGVFYSAPALFLFCSRIERVRSNILFNTEILKIKEAPAGYSITLFSSGSLLEITAERIIDTTSAGIRHDSFKKVDAQKSLNTIVAIGEKAVPECLTPLIHNELANMDIFCFPVEPDDSYAAARHKLHSFFERNAEKLENVRISMIANTFAYRMPPVNVEVRPQFYWIPSCGFSNLLHAIDQGQEDAGYAK